MISNWIVYGCTTVTLCLHHVSLKLLLARIWRERRGIPGYASDWPVARMVRG